MEESWRWDHKGGIIEEEPWKRNHGGGNMEEEAWKRNHGGGIMEEESWRGIMRGDHVRGILKRVSGGHLRGNWESFGRHLASGNHLGAILEASESHLGGIWEASGSHLRGI